jgi:predicted acylesterase/phospholipase RssA
MTYPACRRSPPCRPLRYWRQGILIVLSGVAAACAVAPRRPAPPTVFASVAPPGFPPDVRTLSDDRYYFKTHLAAQMQALRTAAGGEPVRILALSGGGAGGAFGAGALYGLSQSGKRPDFQVVTGVSAGALLAPFAFLGPQWDPQLKEAFDSHRTDNLLKPRGIGFLFRPGFYLSTPLVHLVNRFCTARMISAVANRAKQGRLLLVATTDLDKEESVIWNMGAIAEQGGKAARQLFCKVLVASASIPGVFPPVLIPVEGAGKSYDEMHVDGSTTLPLFIASEIMEEMPLSLVELQGAEVYVIVNGQLNATPKTTRGRPAAVLSRSFSAALMSASRRALVVTADFAHSYHMHFRFTYLPMNYPYQGPLAFRFLNMDDLFQYGAHCADTNRLWTTFRNAITERQLAGAQMETTSDACPGAESVTIQ